MNLAAAKVYAVNAFNTIGGWRNFLPVFFRMMWKKHMTGL